MGDLNREKVVPFGLTFARIPSTMKEVDEIRLRNELGAGFGQIVERLNVGFAYELRVEIQTLNDIKSLQIVYGSQQHVRSLSHGVTVR